jgi:hypothetical protein
MLKTAAVPLPSPTPGENVATHPRKPHGDGQAIVELQELQLIVVRPVVFGLSLAIVLAGHLLNSLVRNSGNSP